MDIFTKLHDAVVEYKEEEAKALAEEVIKQGIDPVEAIEKGLFKGMDVVSEKFDKKEVFLPHLLVAAKSMKNALEVLEPALGSSSILKTMKLAVMATVEGDIHDIGKSIVGSMLTTSGYRVIDLGSDVSVDRIVDEAVENDAEIIGLSAMLTTTMPEMKNLIDELEKRGLRDKFKVIIGGAPTTPEYKDEIGADGYAEDFKESVQVLEELFREKEVVRN